MRSKILLLAVLIALVLSLTVGAVSASADGCRKHYIHWGETLYSIGRKYNVDPYAIAHANYIKHPDYIRGGTWVCVPYGPAYPGYDHGYYDKGYGRYDKGHGYYDKSYGYYGKGYSYYDKSYGYYGKGYGRYDAGYGYHGKYYDSYGHDGYKRGYSYGHGY